jgi:sporulation protein YlmC with PRC-barrel domain
MLKRTTIALLAATVLSAGAAIAQTSTAPTAGPAASASPMNGQFVTEQSTGEFRASKFVGLNVYGADNQKIGAINEIMIDATGAAKAVVIGVGGFLGIGEKNVAVPFSALEWANAPEPTRAAPNGTAPAAGGSAAAPMGAGSTAAPATTGSTEPARSPAETAAYNGYPDHALLRMTKADLQSAPDFKYYAQTQSNAVAPKP